MEAIPSSRCGPGLVGSEPVGLMNVGGGRGEKSFISAGGNLAAMMGERYRWDVDVRGCLESGPLLDRGWKSRARPDPFSYKGRAGGGCTALHCYFSAPLC